MTRQFLVVGLGRLGLSLVETLDSLGHEVLAIDEGEDMIHDLADDLPNVHLERGRGTQDRGAGHGGIHARVLERADADRVIQPDGH